MKKFTVLNVFDATIDNSWRFLKAWKIWISYALALTFFGVVLGNWSHACKNSLLDSWWCPNVGNIFEAYARILIYFFGAIFLTFAFCFDIYMQKGGFSTLLKIDRKKIRFIGFSIGLCALFFIALAIAVWLIFRKANPNWLIEFGFFLIVFSCATLAVLILRTSASFALFLQTGKLPNFKQLFNLTHGKFYVVLITFCVLTYVVNIFLMKIMGFLEIWNIQKNFFYVAISSEFLSNIFKFIILAVYVAYFSALAQCLLPQEFEIIEKPVKDIKPAFKAVRTKDTKKEKSIRKTTTKISTKRKSKKKGEGAA